MAKKIDRLRFRMADGRLVTGSRTHLINGNGDSASSWLGGGKVDGEPIDDEELERLVQAHGA